jgi:hypothetical protein
MIHLCGHRQAHVSLCVQQLNMHVMFPNLPAAELGGGAQVPIEFLDVSDPSFFVFDRPRASVLTLSYLRQLPAGAPIPFARILPAQTAEMIRHSSKRPDIRRGDIDQQRMIAQYETSDPLRAWGVTVAPQMEPVTARVSRRRVLTTRLPLILRPDLFSLAQVLAAPNVVYHPDNRRMPNINAGVWNTMGMRRE